MNPFKINDRLIGKGYPAYIVAEMSANHCNDFNKAVQLIEAAKDCGADAVKLQTYTADTMTIDCDGKDFYLADTIWKGRTLYDLYQEASTPWAWHSDLMQVANRLGIDLFSTPFDATAVDFLEQLDVPVHKIASFEIVDIPLLKKVASTGKPVILSTGMATLGEIEEAVTALRQNGCGQIALLKCTSAYPAKPENSHLRTIPHMSTAFDAVCGISDHTLGHTVALGAVALGASIVEKHFTLSRKESGPDSAFSMEPLEFKSMVDEIRILERALGKVSYQITEDQKKSLVFRRSLFVVQKIAQGEVFTRENIRAIRPGNGLHTRYLERILGKVARQDIDKGTALQWELVQ